MTLPNAVKKKLEKKHRTNIIDTDKNTFEFPLCENIEHAQEFVVGPFKWNIWCLFVHGKKETERKKRYIAPKKPIDDKKKERTVTPIDSKQKYLQLKLKCCDLITDMIVSVNGWAKMCPLKSAPADASTQSRSVTGRRNGNNYHQKKFHLDFSKKSDEMTIYNLCPETIVKDVYADGRHYFKVTLNLRVIYVNFDRCSKFNFKGSTIKTPLSDVTFTIDYKDNKYTYAVNAQFVSMYSAVLAKKIEDNEMVDGVYPPISLNNEFEPAVMRDFLSFIYPCHRPIKNGNVAATLEMAKLFDAPAIRELCQRYLVENFENFTNIQILKNANKYDLPQISALILRKLDTVEGSKNLLEKLEADGKVDKNLKAAIQRRIDHPNRFKRYLPQRHLNNMETQQAERDFGESA